DPGSSRSIRFKPFFEGLRDLGYVDGPTIVIEYLSAEGQGDRFPDLAGQCVRVNADVIVVASTPPAHTATSASRRIPIVMIGLGDAMGTGFVESLARPEGNVTGVTIIQILRPLFFVALEAHSSFPLPPIGRLVCGPIRLAQRATAARAHERG